MAQQYDSVSKYIISAYPQAMAKLVFSSQTVEVQETLSTEQIIVDVGYTDITLRVKRPDGTLATLHIEVQTRDSQEPMPLRMAAYHGYLLREYKMPVCGCVIYLAPNAGKTDPGHYTYEWDGYQYLMQYKVIRLIEIDGQAILETQDPGLLPLTPLMKRPNDMDADRWLDECVKATKAADVAPEVLPNLLAVLSIFSSLVYDSEQINQHIPEVMMHEFPLVQHFIEQGIKQGRQEGHQEGRQEGTEQALTAIAIAMLNDNQPIDTIVKYTGLSEAEIKQLTESVDSTT